MQFAAESLEGANLAGEYLIHVDFRGANLASAQLAYSNLSLANLAGADLSGANLSGANLTEADLTGTNLTDANLAGATMSLTVIARCDSLRFARGLAAVRHPGPSLLDESTLKANVSHLPDNFLRGAGYTRSEIAYLRTLYPARAE